MKHLQLFEQFVNERTFEDGQIAIYDGEDGETYIEKRGKGYYGYNDRFDFEAKDKSELEKKLKSFKYKLVSGSIDEVIVLIPMYNPVEFAQEWSAAYGEDLQQEYSDLYKELLKKKYFTVEDVTRLWKKLYGKDFKKEYTALYKKLDK